MKTKLSPVLADQWLNKTSSFVILIDHNLNILEYNASFKVHSKKFKNIADIVTLTHRKNFVKNVKKILDSNHIEVFKTNLSFNPTDVEDIPDTYEVYMEKYKKKKVQIILEPIAPLSHDDTVAYFNMVNDFSILLRKSKKYEFQLKQKNKELRKSHKKEKELLEMIRKDSLSELIGNIAHHWRQPLTVISTLASGTAFKQDYGQLTPDEITKSMNEIVKYSENLSNTIERFQDFILGDKEFQEVSLYKILDSAFMINEELFNENKIKIVKKYSNSEEFISFLPFNEVTQVFINIFNNSLDAFKERNTQNPWVSIDIEKKDNSKAIIIIEDNAGGIDEAIMSKIFDPYFTTKHQFEGTGLGLYICDQIVQSFHGKIYAVNTQKGVKFCIETSYKHNKYN